MNRRYRLVKWVVIVLASLALLIVVVALVGMALPQDHAVNASRSVKGTLEEVWRTMTTVEAFPEWRPGVSSVERFPDRSGLPVWKEATSTGPMTLEVVRWDPPRSFVTRIADESLPFGGTWTYELESEGEGTRVTRTENGEIYNPIFRFMARFVFGYDGTMRTYLDGLEARMGAGG